MTNPAALRNEILKLTREYSKIVHSSYLPASNSNRKSWQIGDNIPYAGRVFTDDEVEAAVSSTLDFWLTLGKEGAAFEAELAQFLGVKKSLLVNSGSSANLIAVSAITSPKLPENRRLKRGDEVITVAAGFPTTVAPIVQVGAVPVFIDADIVTGNVDATLLESAFIAGQTKAVVLAHALGNPFDLLSILRFCKKYNLWLIEDNCDALGCTYSMPQKFAEELGFFENSPGIEKKDNIITRWTGSWGDISTQSFYPPHHLTMGEGGCVNVVSDQKLKVISESFRDWGRDCWCPSGIDNSCNKRFEWKLGDLPEGYDHKYTYSHLGFNLKPLDPQAAIGRVQLNKLHQFIQARKDNWFKLRKGLESCSDFLDFALPTHATDYKNGNFCWDNTGCQTDCSWFGFKITVKDESPFSRTDLAKHLDSHNIGNRMLFGGNLVRQPAFVDLLKNHPGSFRVASSLDRSDSIMNNTLFLGTYPGLTNDMINHEIDIIDKFCSDHRRG